MPPKKTTAQEKNPNVQVALITTIGTIAAALVTGFFSLIPSLNNLSAPISTSTTVPLSTSTQTVTETPSPLSLPTTEIIVTLVPDSATPILIETPITQNAGTNTTNWNGLLSVRMPTLNEIREEIPVSLWIANVIDVRDMYEPGTDSYSGEASVGTEYLLPIYWCANSSDLLAQNMENIETQFFVNREKIPDKHIFSFTYATDTNWQCSYDAVVIGGWKKGMQYVLDIQRTLATDLSDGQSNYMAGDYIYRLVVNVR